MIFDRKFERFFREIFCIWQLLPDDVFIWAFRERTVKLAYTPEEWLIQANYDLETAEFMLSGGRNIYAVFMSHLAVEKALKAIYHKKFCEIPPKTHSLMYFLNKNELRPPVDIGEFIVELDHVSVATRYPEELSAMSSLYTKELTKEILAKTKESLKWVKMMF